MFAPGSARGTSSETGHDEDISYEVGGTADKGFFRLQFTDQVPGPGESLDSADFDGDGIPNIDEINPPTPARSAISISPAAPVVDATDPLNPDTDGDGLPDGWERGHGTSPNDPADASHLFPGSDVSNLQAYNAGVSAASNATPTNKDGDGAEDDVDADPNDPAVDWAPAAESSYVVIEMEQEDYAGYPHPAELDCQYFYLWRQIYASIGKDGTVLWQDPIKETTTDTDAWRSRYRVWKNGAWSSDITDKTTTVKSITMNTSYPSTVAGDTVVSVTQIDIVTDSRAYTPCAVCGDLILGITDYWGNKDHLPVRYLSHDGSGQTRNDGLAGNGAENVATLGSLDAGSITAYPIDPPSSYELMSWNYFGYMAPLKSMYQYRPVASPGGALAILGTQTTAGVGLWKIWNPPDSGGPSVPGQGSPTVIDAGEWFRDLLLIRAIEDGGVAVGERWKPWNSNSIHQVANDHGSESTLPGSQGIDHSALAICRVPTAVSGQSRLVAAGTDLWVQKDGQWRIAKYKPSANTIIAVAKNGVLLGTQAIWRNGKEISLDSLVANQKVSGPDSAARFTKLRSYAMNSEGSIVALAEDALHPGSGKKTLLTLLPVDLAVDADRNGEITFDGNDTTTAEKPFRFWINNDQDNLEVDEPSVVTYPDSERTSIYTKRDLEDFCRLSFKTGISIADLQNGNWQIGLKFTNIAGSTTPSIHVFPNQSAVGNLDYLTDSTAAANQVAISGQCFQTHNGMIVIPQSYWVGRSDSTAHMIFDGITAGCGNLSVVILDQNGNELGETLGPWIKLLDVRKMYQRARIVNAANQIDDPWVNDNPSAQAWNWDPNGNDYDEDPAAETLACIYVHGWRMTYGETMTWSDTSYKRLWHQGFKGKFYSFRWATYSTDTVNPYTDYFTYNPSEYRAWLCSPALASFVNGLPQYSDQKRIFAHSMGNVTTGAALRAGMQVRLYSLCNAAMSASAYDTDPALRKDTDGNDLSWIGDRRTPDTDPDPVYRAAFGLQDKFNNASFPRMFSFGLPDDSALGNWSWNNYIYKPEEALGYSYSFPPYNRPTWFNRIITSLPETMGYVTKSLTRAAGADLRTRGIITECQNMNDWTNVGGNHGGFDSEHSAEWKWNYQSTNLFWKRLVSALSLKPLNN